METINDYLENILCDFEDYIMKKPYLCDLKKMNFNSGNIPDYSNLHVQQLYLLRYTFAYAFEYKYMYLDLLNNNTYLTNLSVLSIGCGNAVDYWSLVKATNENFFTKYNITYCGIDIIDWNYKFKVRKKDSVCFRNFDVVEFIDTLPSLDPNIYIFPKSISEFSYDEFEIICRNFETKNITNDKIYLLISIRSDTYSMDCDLNRT